MSGRWKFVTGLVPAQGLLCLALACLSVSPLLQGSALAQPMLARDAALSAGPGSQANPGDTLSSDFESRWLETAGLFISPVSKGDALPRVAAFNDASGRKASTRKPKAQRGLVVLQLGDSHTAADFFTSEVRRRLQAMFGNGGAGYVTAGNPQIGVRSSSFKITTSSGWTYKALQRSSDTSEFWLSGFNAITTEAGQTMSFAAEQSVPFDQIEISTVRQPGGGEIDISLDGTVVSHYALDAAEVEPIVLRLVPEKASTSQVRQITIKTTAAGIVSIASVAAYNRSAGISYSGVGFPGATIGILEKFDEQVLTSELLRIAPDIVVLAFGTNEGFNDSLDTTAYAQAYQRVVTRIKSALPSAVIVVLAPPDASRLGDSCKDKTKAACRPALREASVTTSSTGDSANCAWRTPPQLSRVRDIQHEVATRNGLVYWSWASIMPDKCGAHEWASASPPLMARDHVHFTIDGYKKSAGEFLHTLIPVIKELQARSNAVSND